MIIDRTHISWGLATLAASAGAAVIYVANNYPEALPVAIPLPGWLGPSPPLRGNVGATPLGLIYGTLALLIFLFAALLGWRRSHPKWKIGRIQIWLKAHIWLTIFTIPLVLFHCGFHGGGPMTKFLLGLYTLVMVSGFWGLALQHLVPKLMQDYLPEETIFDEIPYVRGLLVTQAEAVREKLATSLTMTKETPAVAEGGTATLAPPVTVHSMVKTDILAFIDREILPYLQAPKAGKLRLQHKQVADDLFRMLKLQVPETTRIHLDEIHGLCDEKRRLDFQAHLQYWLHGWLLVHAPASVLLVVITLWHAIVAVFTYA